MAHIDKVKEEIGWLVKGDFRHFACSGHFLGRVGSSELWKNQSASSYDRGNCSILSYIGNHLD